MDPAPLDLSVALSDYDHVRDLMDGRIKVDNVRLVAATQDVDVILGLHARPDAFDVTEMSFAKYISMAAAGVSSVVALPVFPSRVFRHSALYVRRDCDMAGPKDLEGKTVGIPEWSQTAGIYVRGFLSEDYNVDLTSITWIQAGVNSPGRQEKVAVDLPPGIRYQSRQDISLTDMLAQGHVDAVISARPPNCFRLDSNIVRLWPESRTEEIRHYSQTRIFPILHVVVMRRDLHDHHPGLARRLLSGFEAAKEQSLQRLFDITASRLPLPWGTFLAEQAQSVMGRDLWPYGLDANRPTLDAFCRYAFDQGLTGRIMRLDELFV